MFGFGPRACVDRKFAQIEAVCFLAHFLRDWKVEVVLGHAGETAAQTWEKIAADATLRGTAFSLGSMPIKFVARDSMKTKIFGAATMLTKTRIVGAAAAASGKRPKNFVAWNSAKGKTTSLLISPNKEVVGLVLLLSHRAEVSRLLASRGGISASKFDGDIKYLLLSVTLVSVADVDSRFHAHGPWSLVSVRLIALKDAPTLPVGLVLTAVASLSKGTMER
ncbi:hypothetical protein F5146DRAFT_1003369 [Armillaria mellea]|nr:hypothetical protein F5146DRAFT_1003369 [Armillaria mellea]